MALDPLNFQTPQAYSSFDFSPLAKLGQQLQQQQEQKNLADLAARYGYGSPNVAGQSQPDSQYSSAGSQYSMLGSTPIGGTPRAFSAPASNEDVQKAVARTAADAGMDPAHWAAIAHIESRMNPGSNLNEPTQYKGLFQIGTNEFATHGKGSVYDPSDNANAAASLAKSNNDIFRHHFGRDPTPIETYMMHQQGPGFYTRGTMTNIAGNLPASARIPENMTHQGFERYWARELERRAKFFHNTQFAGEME